MKYDKVHSIYKRCTDIPDIDPTLVSTFKSEILYTFSHKKAWKICVVV